MIILHSVFIVDIIKPSTYLIILHITFNDAIIKLLHILHVVFNYDIVKCSI